MDLNIDSQQLEQIVVTATFPISVADLYPYFSTAEGFTQWWSQEGDVDCRENGRYALTWPAMNWTLRGYFTTVKPEKQLTFTWNWDHHPHLPERTVDIHFKPHPSGSQIILTHGQYTNTADDLDDRQSHIDGWTYFLDQLNTQIQPQ